MVDKEVGGISLNDLYKLKDYLLYDDISIVEDEIFSIIPELRSEKNFEQKSEWHSFDVWNHTLATINACDANFDDRLILLLHDIGKPFSFQEEGNIRHFKNHAKLSAKMAKDILLRLNIPECKINVMVKLIELHSSKIEIQTINKYNIEFYKRLLKIQKCDAKGYEKEHSVQIYQQLENTEIELKKFKKNHILL